MSQFLAPIHHMMYGRIKALNETEALVLDRVKEKLGFEPDPKGGYGYRLPQGNLEDLVELRNIHGWLQEKVDRVEESFAFLVRAVFEKHREKGTEIVLEAVGEAAKRAASEAISQGDGPQSCGLGEAVEILESVYLNGMPCDRGVEVLEERKNSLKLKRLLSVHDRYWRKAGVPSKVMLDVSEKWAASFLARIAPEVKLKRDVVFEQGGGYIVDEISSS